MLRAPSPPAGGRTGRAGASPPWSYLPHSGRGIRRPRPADGHRQAAQSYRAVEILAEFDGVNGRRRTLVRPGIVRRLVRHLLVGPPAGDGVSGPVQRHCGGLPYRAARRRVDFSAGSFPDGGGRRRWTCRKAERPGTPESRSKSSSPRCRHRQGRLQVSQQCSSCARSGGIPGCDSRNLSSSLVVAPVDVASGLATVRIPSGYMLPSPLVPA